VSIQLLSDKTFVNHGVVEQRMKHIKHVFPEFYSDCWELLDGLMASLWLFHASHFATSSPH